MDQQPLFLAPEEEFVGIAEVKVLAPVDLAGGQTVAEHLRHIFSRHLHTYDPFAGGAVIRPILKVVAVAALMVQPRQADAVFLALLVVGTAVPLVIPGAAPELRGTIFAQIMGQALPHQPQPQAVVPHQTPVAAYRAQMLPDVHPPSPLSLFL